MHVAIPNGEACMQLSPPLEIEENPTPQRRDHPSGETDPQPVPRFTPIKSLTGSRE